MLNSRNRWLLTALFATLPLLGWWLTGLFDLDEGFYAAVVGEMNRRGEWITPYFNGRPWFEKPILLYWLAKPSVAVFGEMIGPRLPSVLTTLATYAIVAVYCRRHFYKNCDRVAQLAVGIMGGSLLVLALGRMMMTDAPLMLALAAAFLTYWESLVGDRRWRIVTAACLGVGVLAKGPVACLLFIPVAIYTAIREPELRPAMRGYWLAGVVALSLVVLSWYGPAFRANGELFVQKFLIEQNIGRFTGGDAAHTLGPKTLPAYIPIVVLGMIPWSLWIPLAWPWRGAPPNWIRTYFRPGLGMDLLRWTLLLPITWLLVGRRNDGDAAAAPFRRYLATWALVIFLFFSLSGAKLPHYILPMFPPLAMLVAHYLEPRRWAWPTALGVCTTMALVANAGFLWWYEASGQHAAHTLARYVRSQPGPVAVFQMPRRQKDRGTGGTKLQETSLPSLLLYLDRTVLDTDRLDDLMLAKEPTWIITRAGRMKTDDYLRAARSQHRLERIMGAPGGPSFELYRIAPGP